MKLCWNGSHGPMPVNACLTKKFGEWRLRDRRDGRDIEPMTTIFADDETGEVWCYAQHHNGGLYAVRRVGGHGGEPAIAKINFGPDVLKLVWEPIPGLRGSVWHLRMIFAMLAQGGSAPTTEPLEFPANWVTGNGLSDEGRDVFELLRNADKVTEAQLRAHDQLGDDQDHLALTLAWLEHDRLQA